MDTQSVLKRLMARSRLSAEGEQEPTPEGFVELEDYRHAWFRYWLRIHGVAISGFAAVSGMGRTSISSLAGSGKALIWTRLERRSVEAILHTMNLVRPIEGEALRQALRIPEGLDNWTGLTVTASAAPQDVIEQVREEIVSEYGHSLSQSGVAHRRLLQGRDIEDEQLPSQTYRVLPELVEVRHRTDTDTRSRALQQVMHQYLQDQSLPVDPKLIPSHPRQALSWVLPPDEAATWRSLEAHVRTALVNAALQHVFRDLQAGSYDRVLVEREPGLQVPAMTAGPGRAVTRAYLRQPGTEDEVLASPLWQDAAGQPKLIITDGPGGKVPLWELLSTDGPSVHSLAVFQARSFSDAVRISSEEGTGDAEVDPRVLAPDSGGGQRDGTS